MSRQPGSANRRSFEESAFEYMDALYNLACHLTRNRADAEDLVQETYLRAYTHYDQFEQGTNFKAWIFRILRNASINRYQKEKTRGTTVDLESAELELPRESFPLQRTNSFTGKDLEAGLAQLPDEYRVAVLLAFVEGFTYREIASITNCPIGTVMSRVSRGRRQLRDGLLARDAAGPAFLEPQPAWRVPTCRTQG